MLYGTPGVYGVVTLPFRCKRYPHTHISTHARTLLLYLKLTYFRRPQCARWHQHFPGGLHPNGKSALSSDIIDVQDGHTTRQAHWFGSSVVFPHITPTRHTGEEGAEAAAAAKGGESNSASKKKHAQHYPAMSKTLGTFKLSIEPGSFTHSEIIVLLGCVRLAPCAHNLHTFFFIFLCSLLLAFSVYICTPSYVVFSAAYVRARNCGLTDSFTPTDKTARAKRHSSSCSRA